jgi:hypothetical protein
MEVIIDGVTYVPRASVPRVEQPAIQEALASLTEIQYFYDCPHKHRAWAWDAMSALAPELAELSADNPQAAYKRMREAQQEAGQ